MRWWGSWSEGSHPQGLSPEEEGLLGSFLEPLQDAPRTPSPRIPSPKPPLPEVLCSPPSPPPGIQPISQLLSGAFGSLGISHPIKGSPLYAVQNLWKQLALSSQQPGRGAALSVGTGCLLGLGHSAGWLPWSGHHSQPILGWCGRDSCCTALPHALPLTPRPRPLPGTSGGVRWGLTTNVSD